MEPPSLPEAAVSQYTKNPPLNAEDVAADPFAQFLRWLEDARAAGMIEPGAMALATADTDAVPSLRIVLFKGIHDGQFTFYTDYRGRKAQELAVNPAAAATFWWDRLERQVRIEGGVTKVSRELSATYFATRYRGSQLAAHTSRQSSVVRDRAELEARLAETEARFGDGPVPLPEHWGGYGLTPRSVEFWQGRGGRFHDRLRYCRDGAGWRLERLEP